MEKKCKCCRCYNVYYTKGYATFCKQETGFCSAAQKAINENDICELYLSRIPRVKEVSIKHIDEVLKDIEELEWIYRDY